MCAPSVYSDPSGSRADSSLTKSALVTEATRNLVERVAVTLSLQPRVSETDQLLILSESTGPRTRVVFGSIARLGLGPPWLSQTFWVSESTLLWTTWLLPWFSLMRRSFGKYPAWSQAPWEQLTTTLALHSALAKLSNASSLLLAYLTRLIPLLPEGDEGRLKDAMVYENSGPIGPRLPSSRLCSSTSVLWGEKPYGLVSLRSNALATAGVPPDVSGSASATPRPKGQTEEAWWSLCGTGEPFSTATGFSSDSSLRNTGAFESQAWLSVPDSLLLKDAVTSSELPEQHSGFYSTYFIALEERGKRQD